MLEFLFSLCFNLSVSSKLVFSKRMDLFLDRMRYTNMSGSEPAKCPKCHIIATTLDDVHDKFGFRQMKREDKFSLRRQSRCNNCR